MTEQNEQNVQNTTEQQIATGKKEQIVHWGVKLPVSLRDRLAETLADWKSDPAETQAMTVAKLLDAAQMSGHDIPEEVQKTTGETREAVMVLLKRINSIGASAALSIDDLHAQLQKQINANEELVQKHKEEIEKLNEQNKSVVEELKDQLSEQKEGTASAVRTIQELKANNGNLTTANKALEGQIEGLKTRNDELKQQLVEKTKELKHEKLMREDDRDTYDMTIKDKEEAVNKALADAEKLMEAQQQAKVAQAVGQKQAELYDKFGKEKQILNDEKADLKVQVAELKAELKLLKGQFETLKQQQQAKKPEAEGKGK